VADHRLRTSVHGFAIVATVVVLSAWVALAAAAQGRFDVLARDRVAGVGGLTVFTIRDSRTATCYTLFVLEGGQAAVPLPRPAPALTADQLERVRLAETLRDLQAARDRELNRLASSRITNQWLFEYEWERARIQQEYEAAVVALIPGLYPSAQVAPGLPTSSSWEVDAAARRAIAEGEAVVARSEVDDRLQTLLERFAASQGIAPVTSVSGPVPCPAK